MSTAPVMRVAIRRPRPGCGPAYEALVRGMFGEVKKFPGFLGAELIPPPASEGDYQVVVKFADERHMAAWDDSEVRRLWHTRLAAVAEGKPEYRLLTGLEAWFAPPTVEAPRLPSRTRMALVSWLGIFPTVMALQLSLMPLLAPLPLVLRVGVFTAFVVLIMTWVVMPRLTKWLRPWLTRG
ncbi:MAG TPA: antibiotic biosynthesis monooxygenase [Rhodocyclaceae bacterium]|nr:antibiotic biosynthesis monooxygenase [Rhodocyclaceae bacterium]